MVLWGLQGSPPANSWVVFLTDDRHNTETGGMKEPDIILVAPRGRMAWNAAARFGGQIAAIAANLAATPFILRSLGVELYGVVGVVNTIISFMAIGTASLTSTVGRNLTFAVERGEFEDARKQISTAVFGLVRVLGVALVPLCALALIIDHLIVVPPAVVYHARVLFFLSAVAFLFTTLSGPLGAAMFVRNRLDLLSWTSLGRTLFFLGLVIALFRAGEATLVSYGAAMLLSSVLLCVAHFRIHRNLLPGVAIARRGFDRRILRATLSLGGWMTLNQLGALLFLQTDLLVANRVLGPSSAGQFAAIAVIPMQLRVLAGMLSGLFGPSQAALVARGDLRAFSDYLVRSVRVTTLFFALIIGVFCGTARSVLSIWLGPQFESLAPVAVVLTGYLVITLGVSPTWDAVLNLGRVKIPAVITVIMGGANVILSIVLAQAMGITGIALSGCIMLTLRNSLFTPWYVARNCSISPGRLWREQILGLAVGLVIALLGYGITSLFRPQSMEGLGLILIPLSLLGLLLVLPFLWPALKGKRTKMKPGAVPGSDSLSI